MESRKLLYLVLFAVGAMAVSPILKVGRDGAYTDLQLAVDACPSDGCQIELTDSAYTFSAPVSLRDKRDLVLVGATASGRRPVLRLNAAARELAPIPVSSSSAANVRPIVWQSAAPDTVVDADGARTVRSLEAVLATGGQASKFLLQPGRRAGRPDPARPAGWMVSPYAADFWTDASRSFDEREGFLHGALLQVDASRRIRIQGLDFDGGLPMEFLVERLWNDLYSQFAGVAAISLNGTLQVSIFDCEFRGWSIGVRSVDANPGGLVSDLMDAEQVLTSAALRPLADPGAMGGHRIEANFAHHNRVFVQLEKSWDLASSLRFNRVWDNGVTRLLTLASQRRIFDSEWRNAPGGFVLLRDVVFPPNQFQGNTLVRNTVDLGWTGWRASNSQLFFDNLAVRQERPEWLDLSRYLNGSAHHNWIASTRLAGTGATVDSVIPFCSNARCLPLVPAWGAASIDDSLIKKGAFGDDLGAVWEMGRTPEVIRVQDQTLGYVTRSATGWKVLLPVPVEAAQVTGLQVIRAFGQRIDLLTAATPSREGGVPVALPGLAGQNLVPGVNVLAFDLPAAASDSLWRVEFAVEGWDSNTGSRVHSNLGAWLIRPLGKQLQVTLVDPVGLQPGRQVRFTVSVKDSLGQAAQIPGLPVANAPGWGPMQGKSTGLTGSYEFTAQVPVTEGLSQVVFWGVEPGRGTAIAGAAYVQVGARAAGVEPAPHWETGVRRDGAGWLVELGSLGPPWAQLCDARGRCQRLQVEFGNRTLLRLPGGFAGTYFLRWGDRIRSLVLVP